VDQVFQSYSNPPLACLTYTTYATCEYCYFTTSSDLWIVNKAINHNWI